MHGSVVIILPAYWKLIHFHSRLFRPDNHLYNVEPAVVALGRAHEFFYCIFFEEFESADNVSGLDVEHYLYQRYQPVGSQVSVPFSPCGVGFFVPPRRVHYLNVGVFVEYFIHISQMVYVR